MKKIFYTLMALVTAVYFSSVTHYAHAGLKDIFKMGGTKEHGGGEHKEHGGHEHGGKEHAGKAQTEKEHSGKEHEGTVEGEKEHGGKEHGGSDVKAEPTAEDVRAEMESYVVKKAGEEGIIKIFDPETGTTRKLKFDRVHERVGKTGDYYYSCADFTDTESEENLDLDIDMEYKDGAFTVAGVRIHKVNGKERYTYDENDNRIPVPVNE